MRNVKVEVIAPKHTDHPIMDRLNYHYFELFKDSALFDVTRDPARWYDVLLASILHLFQPVL